MKILLSLLLCSFFISCAKLVESSNKLQITSTSPIWQSNLAGDDGGYAIARDKYGYLYMGGHIYQDDGRHPLIIKLDSHGEMVWKKVIPSDIFQPQYAVRIVVDDTGVYSLIYGSRARIIKFDNADGSIIWQKTLFDGPNYHHNPFIKSMSMGSNGLIYISGMVGFVEGDSYDNNVSVLCIQPHDGSIVWRTDLITVNNDAQNFGQLTINSDGDVIIAGTTNGDFDNPDSTTDKDDIFVAKLNGLSGGISWIKQRKKDGFSLNTGGIDTDSAGNIYVGADYWDATTGSLSAAVIKYDQNGNHKRDYSWKNPGADTTFGLKVFNDVIYLVGQSEQSFFNPLDKVKKGFLLKVDLVDGNILWEKRFGSVGFPKVFDIVTDSSGAAYVAGEGVADSDGIDDAFVAKVRPNGEMGFDWTDK